MNENTRVANKGYLFENFRLFHLRDRRAQQVETHYHEFDKALVFYSGSVDYIIEGVTYSLQPGDVLFVPHNAIHKPLISAESDYERAVFWIRPGYLEEQSRETAMLNSCFRLSAENRACLYHPNGESALRIKKLISGLEKALGEERFGSTILADTIFLQIMIEFNRCVLEERNGGAGDIDPKIDEALSYINRHLSDELSVDFLAGKCYLSRYYFMRRFKESTGYTVHNYICQKRLTAAAGLLDGGMGVTEAAMKVGFSEYSSFLRSFKKLYGLTPSEYLLRREALDSSYGE